MPLGVRDEQNLPGIDQVRVLDPIPIRVPDPGPLEGIAVKGLREIPERVAAHDLVSALLTGRLGRRGSGERERRAYGNGQCGR